MVQGAVRTAAGVLSHRSPGGRRGMRGRQWAGDSLEGEAPQGSGMLAGWPAMKKNNGDVHRMYKKALRGKHRWMNEALYPLVFWRSLVRQ